MSPRAIRIALIAALILAFYYSFATLCRLGDYVRQTNPLSGQKHVEQAFTPTPKELACLYGTPLPDERGIAPATVAPWPASHQPMPNIVHFIWLQKLPLGHAGQGDFDFLSYLAVRSAMVSLKPEAIFFHYGYTSKDPALLDGVDADPLIDNNHWIRRLKPHIRLVRHSGPLDNSLEHSAHMADTMRLEILQEHGGIYLDMDAFALRPFADVLESPQPHDVVLGHEGGNRLGLCNAIIAARPNSTFVRRWLATYDGADLNREWNYHSVLLPKELAGRHPDEVCELPPDAFFWPTWTWGHVRWMHEPISRAEARFWEARIDKTGGSLLDNQLAYHAWSQMARDRYLGRLTPQVVRSEDTRFNLLMRRFMEADL
ncbi:Uncharacterized protein TPAR_06424 [Tolypocladium paradoxum]|uniref:Glycosyl transferase n=1 Tax=Tolypocladium paradoxum TaxID=94208 RepID=A0A2S4KT88_9HYPO|nr:Uncharacterized protein TPAR_06424 [Tolypocladium paradoxum]